MKALQLVEPRILQIPARSPEPRARSRRSPHSHFPDGNMRDRRQLLPGKVSLFRLSTHTRSRTGVEVLEVGEGVSNVPRRSLLGRALPKLRECRACSKGQGNCCEKLKVFGVMMDGGLCERSLIRADKLHPSRNLDYEQLALVETLAIGCHASDPRQPKKRITLWSSEPGPIGLSTLEFNRLTGGNLTVMDMSAERLEFCRKTYGIDNFVQFKGDGSDLEKCREITNGNLFDVVTDATGNPRSMSGALDYAAIPEASSTPGSLPRRFPSSTPPCTARK